MQNNMVIMFVIKGLTDGYFEDRVDFSVMYILSHPVEETHTSSKTLVSSETSTVEPRLVDTPEIRTSTVMQTLRAVSNVSYVY